MSSTQFEGVHVLTGASFLAFMATLCLLIDVHSERGERVKAAK